MIYAGNDVYLADFTTGTQIYYGMYHAVDPVLRSNSRKQEKSFVIQNTLQTDFSTCDHRVIPKYVS